VDLWHYLENEIGKNEESFQLDHAELAERFGVSRTAVINALKTFISANLLEKVSSGRGRGNHSEYRLLWTFREEDEKNVTPTHVEGTTPRKKQTKGRLWRYFAYKFRTLVENSSLADRSQVVVGKILNFLEDKPPDLYRQWLIYLKNWLERTHDLKDFFVYFHRTLKGLVEDRQRLEETKRFIEDQQRQKEKVREEYEEDPPPKSSDFARFSDYLEAIEAWEG